MMVKDIFLTSLEGESFKRIQGSDVPTVFRDDMTLDGDEIHSAKALQGDAGGFLDKKASFYFIKIIFLVLTDDPDNNRTK